MTNRQKRKKQKLTPTHSTIPEHLWATCMYCARAPRGPRHGIHWGIALCQQPSQAGRTLRERQQTASSPSRDGRTCCANVKYPDEQFSVAFRGEIVRVRVRIWGWLVRPARAAQDALKCIRRGSFVLTTEQNQAQHRRKRNLIYAADKIMYNSRVGQTMIRLKITCFWCI